MNNVVRETSIAGVFEKSSNCIEQRERDERRGCYLWKVSGGFPDDQAHGPGTTEAESRQLFTDCRCVDCENPPCVISSFLCSWSCDPLILLRNDVHRIWTCNAV